MAAAAFPAWSAELAAADLQRALAAAGFRGTLRDMRDRGAQRIGARRKLVLDGLTPSEISGQDLRDGRRPRRSAGSDIQSATFELRRSTRCSGSPATAPATASACA